MSTIKIVRKPSYETSDKQLFADKGEAIKHEFKITMRSLFQQGVRADSLSIGQVVDILSKNPDKFKLEIDSHLRVMRGIQSQKKALENPPLEVKR